MTRRLPSVGRADLLRMMDAQGGIDDRAAAACGFKLGKPSGAEGNRSEGSDSQSQTSSGTAASGSGSEESTDLPSWVFVRAHEFVRTIPLPRIRVEDSDPLLTRAELRVRYGSTAIKAPPLVPWSRLAPFLRRALGRSVATQRIHDRKLGRMLAKGLPLSSLPRLSRRAWASQAVVICDRYWGEMAPYQEDVAFLLRMVKRELGKSGLTSIQVDGPPPLRDLARLAPGAPVLALTTLSQYEGGDKCFAAWVAVAKYLTARGHPVEALCPCPRRFWREKVCSVWPITVWDGRLRAPRGGSSQHPLGNDKNAVAATADLLDLLAPAAFVERSLLRVTRLRLGYPADVGCEREAWFHPLGWASSDTFGLVSPRDPSSSAEQARRIQRRGENPLAQEIDALVLQQHQRHSPLIELEARMRAWFSGSGSADDFTAVLEMLRRVVKRLDGMDPQAGHLDEKLSNLAPWFVKMVDRIPPDLRAHPQLAEIVAEGLGLAHRYLRTERIEWPERILVVVAQDALESGVRPLDQIQSYRLALRARSFAEHGGKELLLLPASLEPDKNEFPIASIATVHRYLRLTPGYPARGVSDSLSLSGPEHSLSRFAPDGTGRFQFDSPSEKLVCERSTRPPWARRMWYDRYGLAAEFAVGDVPFVLRWIPPGRFLMGSPEGEPGRMKREGPQHEVTMGQGFWLGETPVTQAQWQAVMGENPSYFKGPPDLPVEQVSWQDCEKYYQRLNGLVPGLPFFLPTEKQWEYACRAGTETALHSGGITIAGEHNAPELDPIAWYGGNSGQDLEVTNPVDSGGWKEKQYADTKAGTHRVKLKQANPWGLHDMLGNVLEWCADVWEEDAYQKRRDATETPPGTDADENGDRAVRGSSWFDSAGYCRAAIRFGHEPDLRRNCLGLRLAAGQEPEAAEPHGAERPSRRTAEGRSHPSVPA